MLSCFQIIKTTSMNYRIRYHDTEIDRKVTEYIFITIANAAVCKTQPRHRVKTLTSTVVGAIRYVTSLADDLFVFFFSPRVFVFPIPRRIYDGFACGIVRKRARFAPGKRHAVFFLSCPSSSPSPSDDHPRSWIEANTHTMPCTRSRLIDAGYDCVRVYNIIKTYTLYTHNIKYIREHIVYSVDGPHDDGDANV